MSPGPKFSTISGTLHHSMLLASFYHMLMFSLLLPGGAKPEFLSEDLLGTPGAQEEEVVPEHSRTPFYHETSAWTGDSMDRVLQG